MLRAWLKRLDVHDLRNRAIGNSRSYLFSQRRRALLAVELLESRITPSRLTVFSAIAPLHSTGHGFHGDHGATNVSTAAVKHNGVTRAIHASAHNFGAKHAPNASPVTATTLNVSVPATATAGNTFSVTITAKGTSGTTATGFSGSVTLTASDGQPVHVLTARPFANGVAVDTVYLTTADTLTLTASAAALKGTSNSMTIKPGSAASFVVSAPSTAAVGTPFSVTLTAKDAYGNTVTAFGSNVSFTSSDRQAVHVNSQSGFTSGAEVFSLTLNTADTLTLTAASGQVKGTSGSMNVVQTATLSSFVVSAPASTTAGTGFSVTVTAKSNLSTTLTSYSGSVTLTASDNQTVQLQSPLSFTNGVAVVTVTLDKADTLTLEAVSGNNTGTSASISNAPAAASSLIVTAPASAVVGTSFGVTLTAKDAYGNTVTGYSGSAAVTASDLQTVNLAATPAFSNGVAQATVTLNTADTLTLTATSGAISGTSGSIVVSAATVGSDWFSANMPDAGLQALARTDFQRDGTLTFNDMLGLFAEAVAAGTITTAELQSLQALVTPGGVAAVNLSASIQSLTYKVVDGDPANATYQGAALGNLQAGSPASRLQDLVNKWFLGEDTPAIDLEYLPGWTVTYGLASGTLFANGGPSYKDVYQGEEGDCWLLASFAVTAAHDPSVIQNMFTSDGTELENGVQVPVWTVEFYDNGVPTYLTVNDYLPESSGDFVYDGGFQSLSNSSNVLWVPLAEKAYAQLSASGWNARPQSNAYASLNGGNASTSLPLITGMSESSANPYSSSANLSNAISGGILLTLGSYESGNSALGIVGDHDYGVLGYNSNNQTFELLNPWGWNNTSAPGILNLTYSQLTQNFFLDGNDNPPSSPDAPDNFSDVMPTGGSTTTNGPIGTIIFGSTNDTGMGTPKGPRSHWGA